MGTLSLLLWHFGRQSWLPLGFYSAFPQAGSSWFLALGCALPASSSLLPFLFLLCDWIELVLVFVAFGMGAGGMFHSVIAMGRPGEAPYGFTLKP